MITCEVLSWQDRIPLCTARIPLCRDEIFPCNCLSPPKQYEKVHEQISLKISTEVHFNRSKIFLLCFYDTYDANHKVNKCLCRISSFYRSSHQRHFAKEVLLKILQYSQENTCVGVSLQGFRSVLWILQKKTCKRLLLILWKRIDTAED